MCRRRRNILALEPRPAAMRQPASHNTSATIQTTTTNNNATSSSSSSSASATTTSSATTSSSISTHQLSLSISKNPTLYPFTDISAATNNFLSKRLPSSSSSAWRCNLRGKDVVIFQRAYRGDPVNLPSRLSALCKSHHSSLIKLLGASVGGGYIYLVYQYTAGASLEDCLRNPRNPNFTPLSKWISRMQIAADLAQGLDYIHVHCNTIHNRIKSSSIVVTEPFFNAMICHFGAADLAHEIPAVPPPPPPPPPVSEREKVDKRTEEEIEEVEEKEKEKEKEKDQDDEVSESSRKMMMRRSKSNGGRFEGTRGYIAPEVIAGGGRLISQKSDVFAFGVVVLELISGREPLKYRMKKNSGGEYEKISLIDTARDAIGMMEDEEGVSEMEVEERRGRIRQWVDRRLRDSFPVEVVEKLMRVALRCVEEEAFMRPDMTWVAGKVSKLFLDSKVWDDNVRVPADFSVTYGPR